MTSAISLGYVPQVTYEQTCNSVCGWLAQAVSADDWRAQLSVLASYSYESFEYEGEDDWFGAAPSGYQFL